MTSYEQELIDRLKEELYEAQQRLVDYKVVTPEETKKLLDDGWLVTYTLRCDHCHGNGCSRCHDVGAVVTLLKEGSTRFGAMVPSLGMVGAGCTLGFNDMKLSFMARGRGGSATLAFHYRQLYSLLEALIRCLASPGCSFGLSHYGIEAEFRGPPALRLAALTQDRITVAVFPDERQQAALDLLRNNGLADEANLLASAFEHEIFRGDCAVEEAARAAVGEIKPGVVFQRVGEHAVTGSADGRDVVLSLDSDRMLLRELGKMGGR